MPFVPFNWQLPLSLSSSSQSRYMVNIQETAALKEELAKFQSQNLELKRNLLKEQDNRHEIDVKYCILEMEQESVKFENEQLKMKLENDRIEIQQLQIYNNNLRNTLEALTEQYKNNLEEIKILKNSEVSKVQQSQETSQSANQLELTKRFDELSAKYECLVTSRDQMEAELNKTKAELTKSVEKSKSSSAKLPSKRVLKSHNWKYKKKNEGLKCLFYRESFTNLVTLYRHRRKCKSSGAKSFVSSRASSMEPSVTQVSRSSPILTANESLNAHKTTPSTSSQEILSTNASIVNTFSDFTEAIQSSDVSKSTQIPNTSEANPSPIATPTSYPNSPKVNSSFEFQTSKPPPPQIRPCSVLLRRIFPENFFESQSDSSSSLFVECQNTRDSLATVKKHSRDLTKRHKGFCCLCKLQFPNRHSLDRHVEHQRIIQENKMLSGLRMNRKKKILPSEGIAEATKKVKVEQDD